jgi:hypothetical protein
MRRLELSLDERNARQTGGRRVVLDRDVTRQPVLELQTDAGELNIVPEPEETRGYDDLRRRATREPIGRGLRPSVALPEDHARMLAAVDRERDHVPLQKCNGSSRSSARSAAAADSPSSMTKRAGKARAHHTERDSRDRQMHHLDAPLLIGVRQLSPLEFLGAAAPRQCRVCGVRSWTRESSSLGSLPAMSRTSPSPTPSRPCCQRGPTVPRTGRRACPPPGCIGGCRRASRGCSRCSQS